MTDTPEIQPPATPADNPAKSVREWESFFAKWGRVQEPEPAKATTEVDLFE